MSTGGDGATGELLNALATDVRTMLRQELDQLRDQLRDTAEEAKAGAVLLGGAGVLGALAVGTSAAMLVRILERVVPQPWASVAATTLYAGGSAALARAGLQELQRARADLPRSTRPAGPAAPTA